MDIIKFDQAGKSTALASPNHTYDFTYQWRPGPPHGDQKSQALTCRGDITGDHKNDVTKDKRAPLASLRNMVTSITEDEVSDVIED